MSIIEQLIKRGVVIPGTASVYISPDVKSDAIAPGVVLHPGVRIEGSRTSIGPGSVIGSEGPATVINCQLARNVTLGSGYFEGSVFLDGSCMGGGAHVRPGCLLEEQASGAHSVGLKQTVLMSYVTLGSLINFCDCLMSGGTGRKNHSEVGSSYIHFNYTPHQDKATASLIGDVPRGVLLNQPPVFLGGQGGLVGPAVIAFGAVIPAGQIIRKDVSTRNQLVVEHAPPPGMADYASAAYGKISRVIRNNLQYIGNIRALRAWYVGARARYMDKDPHDHAAYQGALGVLDLILNERIKRLDELAAKMPASIALLEKRNDERARASLHEQGKFLKAWPAMQDALVKLLGDNQAAGELAGGNHGESYLKWVAGLAPDAQHKIEKSLDLAVLEAVNLWK